MKKVTKKITIEQVELDEQEVQAVRTTMHLIPQLADAYCNYYEDCDGCPLADGCRCLKQKIANALEYVLGYDAVGKGAK